MSETDEQEAPRNSGERKRAPQREPSSRSDSGEKPASRQRPSSSGSARLTARQAASRAMEQLQELTTRTPESVVGVERDDDGWTVTVEVVESRKIPDTADILAEYEVTLDKRGELTAYSRRGRYTRGRDRDG